MPTANDPKGIESNRWNPWRLDDYDPRRARSQANSRAHGARGSCAAQGRQIARGTDSLDTTSTQSPQHNAPHWAHGPAATAWQ